MIAFQAVDVVGQAGKPKTITGFQTHTTPVLLAYGERAELATEECILSVTIKTNSTFQTNKILIYKIHVQVVLLIILYSPIHHVETIHCPIPMPLKGCKIYQYMYYVAMLESHKSVILNVFPFSKTLFDNHILVSNINLFLYNG